MADKTAKMNETPLVDAVSDWIIAISYFAIPIELIFFYIKLRIARGYATIVLALFVSFITFCGITHVCNALVLKQSNHIVKAITAAVSCLTAVAFVRVIPAVFSLPGQMAKLNDRIAYEVNMKTFNQTIVLCTRNLNDEILMRLAEETLRQMFPIGRVAIVESGVQLRHNLQEIPIDSDHCILLDPAIYETNMRFFDDVAHQLGAQNQTPEIRFGSLV